MRMGSHGLRDIEAGERGFRSAHVKRGAIQVRNVGLDTGCRVCRSPFQAEISVLTGPMHYPAKSPLSQAGRALAGVFDNTEPIAPEGQKRPQMTTAK